MLKIVLLYDSGDEDAKVLHQALRIQANKVGEAYSFDVSRELPAACEGCFGCWTKTPGLCALPRDAGTSYLEKSWDADYIVTVSRILWGAFSMPIKAYTDRLIPTMLPGFKKMSGMMRHRTRYGRIPILLACGYGAASLAEEKTFCDFARAQREQGGVSRESGSFIVPRGASSQALVGDCSKWLAKELTKEPVK